MKKICLAVFLALGIQVASGDENFTGMKKVMDQNTYERSGLGKLNDEERAVIDDFVRDYVAGKQKVAAQTAASTAIDRAVKENKVRPPDVFESRIVGAYSGYGPRTFFHLENGQVWRPTNDEVVKESAISNPTVVIYHDMLGYKMFVEGASHLRVKRVQ